MAQGRRISGILVPIQLDTSNVQKDMEDLSKGLGTVINSIQKKFEGALNTKDLANNVVKVTRAMGDLRDSADALGRINGVNIFKSNLSGLSPALKDISAAFGGTVQQQKELYAQLVKTQAIDQQVKALETLQRMLKITAQEAVKLAQSRGVKLSSEALSQVLPAVEIAPIEPSRFKRFADSLRTQFREAAQAAGTEGNAALERSFVKEGLLKQVYADIKKVAEGTGVAKSEMAAFFESIGKGGVWDKFNPIAQMKAQIEQLPRVLTGASDTYKKYSELLYTSGFKETPGALGKYEQGLRDTAAINAAKELAAATGMSAKELRAEAEAAGFTKEMLDKLIPSTKQLTEFSSQLGKAAADYRRLATSAGVTPSQEGYQKFLDTANIRRSISAFEQLNIGQKVTTANFEQIATAAKVSTQQVADYVQAVSRANTIEQLPRVLTGASDSYKKYSELLYTSGFKETPGTLGKYEQALRDNAAVAAAKELGSVLNLPSEQLRKMAEAAGYSKEMLDKLAPSMKSVAEASTRTLTGASDSYKKYSELLYTSGFKETPGALGRYEQGLRDTAAINAAKELAAATGMSAKELRAEAEAAGFTKEMLDKLIPSTKQLTEFSSQLGKASAEYRRLATMSGVAPSQEGYQKFLDTKNIRSAISAFEQLNIGQKVTTANFEQIATAAKVSTQQVAEYIAATTKAQATVTAAAQKEGRGLMGIFTPSSISAGAQSALAATGVVTGMYGITELVKSSYQASMKMDSLNLSFESIYGSAAKAGGQINYVREVSDKLGLSFTDTAEGAKKLFASARGTEVEKDINQIFGAFSTMSAALKLTGDETNSVFLAISQMISKGKVSAEELRLQLAERMPGAVTLFAKSIGVTTKELDQMLQNGQVGLDSLRKFALEVEKTYASGAAGAAKGVQAELNRVASSWFFLKQAFVDTKGTAELLSTISSALKAVTDSAPQITATASAILKLGMAVAGVYAVAKAFAALDAVLVSLQSLKTILTLRAALTSFAAGPVGATIAIGAMVAAAWSITPANEAAAKALKDVTFDIDTYGEAAKNAANSVGKMSDAAKKASIESQTNKYETALSAFKGFGEAKPSVTYEHEGVTYATGEKTSAFSQSLEALKRFSYGPGIKDLITQGQAVGQDFFDNFYKALSEGASGEKLDVWIKTYATKFQQINKSLQGTGISEEDLASFKRFQDLLLGGAQNAQVLKQGLDDIKNGATDSANAMQAFNNAFDAITKMTKDTELGKTQAYKEQAKGVAEGLVSMSIVAEAAKNKLAELGERNKENATTWDTNTQVVERFTLSMSLLGQDALKNKSDLGILEKAIDAIADKFKGAESALSFLRDSLKAGFQVAGEGEAAKALDKLKTQEILAGQTTGTKQAISALQPFLKEGGNTSSSTFVSAFVSGSKDKMKAALGMLNISEETANALISQARASQSATDAAASAKKAQSNWESVNSVIQNATKTLESWRGKIDESKADQFGATIAAEIEKIDKAMRSSKGNSEQIAQLKTLRDEILKTGEMRKRQIQYEQEREQSKEMTRYRTRITAGYKKLEGVDNIETYAAAKGQYEDDVKFFQHALDEKRISQEDFNSYMMMLNKTLADAQLRSQTDMFSRLKVAANDYYKKYGDFTRHIGDVVTTAMDSSAKAIAAFARSGASDFASLASAFARMAEQILATATDLFAQQAVSALWKGLGDWVGSLSSPFGGAYSSGKVQEVPRGPIGPSANGNVFSGGNLSAYSGSIVSSPTLFNAGSHVPAYATGAGLMGEAGPEGIFPLTRINGKLGVRAEMGQQQPTILNQAVSVNINNASGSQVTTQQTKDNQGNISIDVMIEEAVGKSMRRPGSSPYKSLQSNFGARQQLASV